MMLREPLAFGVLGSAASERALLVLVFNPARGINGARLCADSGRAVLVPELEKRKKNAGKTRKRTKKSRENYGW